MSEFDGKLAVVTGGASGIGAATVATLRDGGADVVVADVTAGEGVVITDITDEQQVQALFGSLDRRPDISVHCAGVNGNYGPLLDLDLDAWKRTVDINLTGSFLCVREAIRAMGDGPGSIVNISSGAGMRGFANLPDYVASKHGVIGLTRAVALEYARKGIRVNVIAPGTVRTPMLEGFVDGDEGALHGMGSMTPSGRLGTPEEIADAVAWLCSDRSIYVTGAVLAVDGGVSAA
jgi:NAD(P)-dependent dehydrogenase (short-subunit alcohol dehydrogenase family)